MLTEKQRTSRLGRRTPKQAFHCNRIVQTNLLVAVVPDQRHLFKFTRAHLCIVKNRPPVLTTVCRLFEASYHLADGKLAKYVD